MSGKRKPSSESGLGSAVGGPLGDELGVLAFGGEEGVARAESGCLDRLGDVEDVVALGDGEGAGVDVAAEQAGRRPRAWGRGGRSGTRRP